MKKQYKTHNIKGIGLIEVLTTIVIVAFGLIALATLQADFMSNSGDNKARSIAITLGEQKVEEFKNNIIIDEFNAHVAGLFQDTPAGGAGSNATFTRTWTITDQTDPSRKTVAVEVSWGNAADESVSITSEIIWANPAKAANSADSADGNGVGGLAPSPNNNSSSLDGDPAVGDLAVILDSFPNIKKGQDQSGKTIVVDDVDGDGSNLDTLLTCNGDTIITFTGTVYTVNALASNARTDNISVDVSQYGVCEFDSADNDDEAPYACFVCGNCTDSPNENGCPASPNPVGSIGAGGWYGKIGLRGVDDDGGNKEKVCFNEQILDPEQEAASAREFVSRRTLDGVTTSEGINEPYECMNFLIVNQTGPDSSCTTVAETYANKNITFAPKNIYRLIPDDTKDESHPDHSDNQSSANNKRLALNSDYCLDAGTPTYLISGTITGSHLNKVTLSINTSGVCEPVKVTNSEYTYTCTATTDDSSVVLTATTTQNNATVDPGVCNIELDPDIENYSGCDFEATN